MKIFLTLSMSLIFLSGCSTLNKAAANSDNEARLISSEPNSYTCLELTRANKNKIKSSPEEKSNPIQMEYKLNNSTEISDVIIKISEDGKLSDVFSSDLKTVKSEMSAETIKPLAGLVVFRISEENGDRFEFLASSTEIQQEQFYAYGKITFGEDASKTIRLNCNLNKGR